MIWCKCWEITSPGGVAVVGGDNEFARVIRFINFRYVAEILVITRFLVLLV